MIFPIRAAATGALVAILALLVLSPGLAVAQEEAAANRKVVIVNETAEAWWDLEVTGVNVLESPLDDDLEVGGTINFEIEGEDSGCYYNLYAEGDDSAYGNYLIDFCSVDSVRVTSADRFRIVDDDAWTMDSQFDGYLTNASDGFVTMMRANPDVAYMDDEPCATAPAALGLDDSEAEVCRNTSKTRSDLGWREVLAPGVTLEGEWFFRQSLGTFDTEDEAEEFMNQVGGIFKFMTQLDCGDLETDAASTNDAMILVPGKPACASAAIVIQKSMPFGHFTLDILVAKLRHSTD